MEEHGFKTLPRVGRSRPLDPVHELEAAGSSETSDVGFEASDETSAGECYSSNPEDRGHSSAIVIWVTEKPFEFGTLPIYPSAKMSLPILMKILGYCRQKGWSDTLSLGSWYHICKCKLRLSYHIGWTYIRLFNILFQQMETNRLHSQDNEQWDERCNTLKSKKYDRRDEFKVPTLKFMLFLLIQHSYRVMSKHGPPTPPPEDSASLYLQHLQSRRDSESSDDEFDVSAVEREEKKIIDEQLQYKFVHKYLAFMVNFLETDDPDHDGPRLKLEIVNTFDLILRASTSSKTMIEANSLKYIIMSRRLAGYDKLSHTVDRQLFIRWVKRLLRVNPWGPSSGFLKAPIPQIITGVVDEFRLIHTRRENRIMRNNSITPSCWYTISSVNEQVLVLNHIRLHSDIRISKCRASFIYLCGSFSCVGIEWCRDCTIFLGCVSGVLRLTGCRGVRLIALARQIIINETVLSTFHVHTPCAPIIAGHGSSQLYFGPYTSFYQRLRTDMRLSKMSATLSQWDKVRGISYDGLHVNNEHQWSRIEGKLLQEFYFPFNVYGPTTSNPILLQARHSWALEKKKRSLEKWTNVTNLMEIFKLNTMDLTIFQSILFRRFIKFLLDRKHHHEILALVSYNEALLDNRERTPPQSFEGQPKSLEDVLEILLDFAENRRRTYFLGEVEDETDSRGSTAHGWDKGESPV